MVLQNVDIRIASDSFHQSALNLKAGVVSMMENAKLRMAAFAMQVEAAIGFLIEIHAPFYQFTNALRRSGYDLPNGIGVGYPIACNHGIVDVLFKIIYEQVGYGGYAALRLGSIGFAEARFAAESDTVFLLTRHFQRETHSRYSGPDYEIVIFTNHDKMIFYQRKSTQKPTILQKNFRAFVAILSAARCGTWFRRRFPTT